MTLRLVLVSLVAALGLRIPGGPMIESWVASTQNWMNARFADWDTRNSQTADYVIISDYYDAEHRTPRREMSHVATPTRTGQRDSAPVNATTAMSTKPAPVQDPQTANVRPVSFVRKLSSFEPLEIGDKTNLGIAYELKRWTEGMSVMPPWVILSVASRPLFEPIAVAENLYGGIALELNRKNEGIGIKPPAAPSPRPVPASLASFGPMEASPSLYFAGELVLPAKNAAAKAPTPKPTPTPVAICPAPPVRTTKPRESLEDLDIEVAGELVPQDDGFGVFTPAPKTLVTATKPRFEPLEVSDNFYVGVAFELNRRNEGLHIPAESLVRTAKAEASAPLPTRKLSQAVKLTRDAVYAWLNVFTGPALVTVSQSNQ
jgi:hypothetical protein